MHKLCFSIIILLSNTRVLCQKSISEQITSAPEIKLLDDIQSDYNDQPIKNEKLFENVQNSRLSKKYTFIDYILNNYTSTQSGLNSSENNSEEPIKHVTCIKNLGNDTIEIVDRTELIKLLLPYGNQTSLDQAGRCLVLFFYAAFCPFSSMAAPHFNALPRAFPDIKMAAVDASIYHSFNTQYGIVGIPTLMLFHQGRQVARYNQTDYNLEMFVRFLKKHTRLEPKEKFYVTSADFAGPLSSVPEKRTDFVLVFSWLFIVVCAVYYFSKSIWWKSIVEMIKNNWRESEAQHEHND